MASLNKTLQSLYDLQMFGMKVGLQNIWSLSESFGHPELRFPCIHIAGTNGKGSTSSMVASILTASGYRTGLYTSPHLVHFAERIRIDGKPIPVREIARYTNDMMPAIKKLQATFFEATTAMAFRYFADRSVDIAVIETGLGGRLDATNIVAPLLSVITTIGFDHTEHLGKTLSAIAGEKGGIIKPFVPCVVGMKNAEALRRLKQIAREQESPFIQSEKITSVHCKNASVQGTLADISVNGKKYDDLFISLPGDHQVGNARIALTVIDELRHRYGYRKIQPATVAKGLSDVQQYSGLSGRIDLISTSPIIVADVAHNPDGIRTLFDALRKLVAGKMLLVFGVMADKDYGEMIRYTKPFIRKMIAVKPGTSRALDTRSIVRKAHEYGIKATGGGSVENGISAARKDLRKDETMLIAGSHYVVGEALTFFENCFQDLTLLRKPIILTHILHSTFVGAQFVNRLFAHQFIILNKKLLLASHHLPCNC